MNHVDIVKLIKESGNSITLSIGAPIGEYSFLITFYFDHFIFKFLNYFRRTTNSK